MLAGILLRLVYRRLPVWMVNLRCVEVCCGMAGNQGRCAALCGNCRDDYGVVIVIAQGDVVTTDVVFKPFSPLILALIFRLLTA